MKIDTSFTHRKLLLLALVALFCTVVAPSLLKAQLDERTAGTSYVLAFPDTTTNTFDARFPNTMADKIYIYIYSAVDNRVTIQGIGYNRIVNPVAGKFEIVDLTDPTFKAQLPIVTEVGKISNNTFRLTAQSPIIVYCYIVTKFGAEAWTPIPVDSWGTNYYAAALPGEIGKNVSPNIASNYQTIPKAFPAEITVVAAYDSTIIRITPGGRLLDSAKTPTTITLNRNQAYQVQSFVDTSKPEGPQSDLGGSHITSNKPIGVLSGNTRGQVEDFVSGVTRNIFKNMMIEWLAPVEQHGHEFVYMPTQDGRQITGQPNEDLTKKRQGEWVRMYATKTQPTTGYLTNPATGGSHTNFTTNAPVAVGTGGFFADRIGVPEAVYFKTDQPAQAFMNTTAVAQLLSQTGGVKYDGYGTYMVELTPREQWVNFAPCYAPNFPSNMEHFINVVTDINSAEKIYYGQKPGQPMGPFPFTKQIKGTDLIWGSISVNAGLDFYLTGWSNGKQDASVRFAGFMYGFLKGREEYRTSATKKKDDGGDGSASAGGGKGVEILDPAQYEEYLAVAYAYPLAPARTFLRASDSLQIDTSSDCSGMTVTIKAPNDSAVGLKSITLENPTNAKLEFIDATSSQTTVKVSPIDRLQNASATVVITGRTDKIWQIPYQSERVDLIPTGKNGDDLDFGQVTINRPSDIKTVTVTNPLTRPVTIKELKFVQGNQDFQIISPTIPPAITLQPGQSINIQVQITPTVENRLCLDSLRIILGCTEVRIKLIAETAQPCIYVNDLDFGTLRVDESKTLPLKILNQGRGIIIFNNPAGAEVITWLETNFTVSRADLDTLKATVLGPGEFKIINVTFKSSVTGVFRRIARVWASTRDCRDTSVWNAEVTTSSSVGSSDESSSGYSLSQNDPNPLTHSTTIEFTLGRAGMTTLEVYNAAGQKVATVLDAQMEAGSHKAMWDASGVAAGVYYYRLTSGAWTQTRAMIVK